MTSTLGDHTPDLVEAHPSELSPGQRAVGTVLRSRELAVGLVLLVLVAATAAKSSSFLFGSDGWRSLLVNPSILILLAVGQTVVIVTRNVDLSVGSTMGLTAYLTGRLFVDTGLPAPVVVLCAVGLGAALGLVNGVLVAFGKVPALVITLGTLYIYRGIFLTWAGSDRITASDIPDGYLDLGTAQVLTLPVLTLIALVVLAVVGYHLHTARSGRELYAIGSDPDAAVLYGLKVTRRVLLAFVLSGALAGLAGAFYVARYGTVSSGAGLNMELQAVGAAVIGGVAIFGGSGTVWGAAIGATLLVTINSALPVLGIQDFWQRAVVGALILAAVVLDRVLAVRQERRLALAREAEAAQEAAQGAAQGAAQETGGSRPPAPPAAAAGRRRNDEGSAR
ncbi:ABC transporter permease [Nocardioides sp. SYSU DS0651]|uniref:ABC transporter permease n=1 Tax=Nocardioides sp. SYSU DS0651 TaxID=3415955 RepID=UPI003F4C6B34